MLPVEAVAAEAALGHTHPSDLPRDRVLHRLQQAVTRRLVLITAGPGFGKSALLADFCRQAPDRTAVVRLGPAQRTPEAFARSIGRAVDAMSGSVARAGDDGAASTWSSDATCLRSLGAIARPTFLILDDFHHVDDVPEIGAIVHAIAADAPDGLRLIIGSRRRPALPLARFRASGELVEIGPEHLHFDGEEAARLFETHDAIVGAEVIDAVHVHTGGWPAALRMVEAVIRDAGDDAVRRCPECAIAAARSDIHAYLAEEVIASIPQQLLAFLLRTSVLDDVHAELAALAAGTTPREARDAIDAARVAGLVWNHGAQGATTHRYRPVVREYLEAELRAAVGEPGVAAIHRTIAVASKESDWRTAARHAARARDESLVGEVIVHSLDAIVDRGEAAEALALLDGVGASLTAGVVELLASRAQFRAGRLDRALDLAQHALGSASAGDGVDRQPDVAADALSNLRAIERVVTCRDAAGPVAEERDLHEEAERFEEALRIAPPSPSYRRALLLLGSALVSFARGMLGTAIEQTEAAADELRLTGSPREVALALELGAWAAAHDGRWPEARLRLGTAVATVDGDRQVLEVAVAISSAYGDPDDGRTLEADLSALQSTIGLDAEPAASLAEAIAAIVGVPVIAIAAHDASVATVLVAATSTSAGGVGRHPSVDRASIGPAIEAAEHSLAHAVRTGARVWVDLGRLLTALARGGSRLSDAVSAAATGDGAPLVVLAPIVAGRLDELNAGALDALAIHAAARPERWRAALRAAMGQGSNASRLAAGRSLVAIGTAEDITPLHQLARGARAHGNDATLARHLARRLAPPVFFEDLGRVAFTIGPVVHAGTTMRRKVLALVCFLMTRPDLSATRDQVLDALWPELEPEIAANSLNQTIYFLRRILDPTYVDERSADYVHHDSDVVWLDPDLVTGRSRRCREIVRRCRPVASHEDVDALSEAYTGRFALDFFYESWAEPYRESLHAAYLEVIERAVEAAAASGQVDRAIALARRALEVDPGAEQLELALLRLYRRAGALAAAAEQYSHYASVLREEQGVEPPPLEAI
ncbi:MAG TPA: BTAD domain-containing putative transcriptional regulator [Candidatus Limnocylindrales bacterium]